MTDVEKTPDPSETPRETAPDPAGSAPASRRRRLPRLLLGVLAGLLLLILVPVCLVLGTQTGLRFAVQTAEGMLPGLFSVGRVDGRLLGRLSLRDFSLTLPALDVGIETLELDWTPSALLQGLAEIDRLAVSGFDLALGPSADKEDTPFSLPEILLPVRLDVGEATLERFRLLDKGAEAPMLVLDRARLVASLDGGDLQVVGLDASLSQPRLSANARGHADLVGQYPLELDLDWRMQLPPEARLDGSGHLEGDLDDLRIRHRLTGSAEATLEARVRALLSAPSWEGRIQVARVDLPAFAADLPQVETRADLETRGDPSRATVTGSLDAKAPDLPDFGHLAATLDLLWSDKRLDIRRLDLTEEVSKADLNATGHLDLATDPGAFELEGQWRNLRWPLSGDLVARSAQGALKASGDLAAYDYSLSAQAEGPSFPASRLALRGTGTAEGTRIASLLLETLRGRIEGGGDLAWSPEPSWNLHLDGKDLDPGAFVEGLDDRIALALTTEGGLQSFDYDLSATTSGPGLPPAALALIGSGDLAQTRLETLRLDVFGGRVDGEAKATFDPKVTWDAAIRLSGIDPGSYAPEWPGRIDGRLTSHGSIEDAGPDLVAVIESLKGRLRGYPIAASGRVSMAEGQTRLENIEAQSGTSRVGIQGTVDQSLDLAFDLESPDLSNLLPDAKGRLSAQGKVTGPLEGPRIRLDLKAKDAAFGEQGLASLVGKANLDLAEPGRFDVDLDGKDLFAGGMLWDALTLRGEGSMPDHRVSLQLDGTQLAAKLDASGGLSDTGVYRGRLSRLDLVPEDLGRWSLEKAAPFALDGAKVQAGPLCLRQDRGSGGCIGFDQSAPGKWLANLNLDSLDFALLEGFLPDGLDAEGAMRVTGRFQADGSNLDGRASAEIDQGRIKVDLGQGRYEAVDFSGTRLTLNTDAKGLSTRLELPLGDLGGARGSLDLPGWRFQDPAAPGQRLQGQLKAQIAGLERIASLVPDISNLAGSLDVDLGLGGTIGKPGVKGRAAVSQVGFEVPLIALVVKDLNLEAVAPSQERMDLRGGALVGGGRLDVSGEARFGAAGPDVRIGLNGKKLKVADTKEYYALISPDFEIEAGSKGASVRGQVRISEARIRPRSVPAGTVSPSSDVVMEERTETPPYPLDLDVGLVMGKDVTIDAFGVRGRLAGGLRVLQRPGADMLGDGQLQITEGEYRLSGGFGLAAELGAPLTITQGRLIYAKSPIDNPGLLLQAERAGGDTTAGVRVLGTLRDPKLAFFSESDPDMTQAEITKYLVTGIPPSANDQTNDAGLAVGTYVAPRIYMEYESGLGDEANKVKLRYDLTRHIELQTETGDNQGADIYFKFEN
ncbi:translocation/assembly module TamB domain-containing protein [Imhoffiella purpurea]|uniref:Translocation and assembly module TamB C-terminal domain-containing protein n=1 Tax=Imhoffiella purpurea TaxID=1249627 RepID=W9VTB9_9GAMM|nr:translocation/assembly module TamB domain-containing protein [Imhoffiella purpurea]EXJ13630.1 hypothetical protein D779_3522 [Imhoffiella purpurea]